MEAKAEAENSRDEAENEEEGEGNNCGVVERDVQGVAPLLPPPPAAVRAPALPVSEAKELSDDEKKQLSVR